MNKVAIIIVTLILAMAAGLAGSTCTATAQSVSKETYIIPAIGFTVDPSSIDFDTSEPHTVTITNTGAGDLLVTGTVTDKAGGLYVVGLKLDSEPWGLFSTTIKRDGHQEIDVTLTVPENYTGVGESGTLNFWVVPI